MLAADKAPLVRANSRSLLLFFRRPIALPTRDGVIRISVFPYFPVSLFPHVPCVPAFPAFPVFPMFPMFPMFRVFSAFPVSPIPRFPVCVFSYFSVSLFPHFSISPFLDFFIFYFFICIFIGVSKAYLKHGLIFCILEGWLSLIRRSFTSDNNYSPCRNYPLCISININNPFFLMIIKSFGVIIMLLVITLEQTCHYSVKLKPSLLKCIISGRVF